MPTPDNFYSFSSHRPQTVFALVFRFQTGYACEKWPKHMKPLSMLSSTPPVDGFSDHENCNKATSVRVSAVITFRCV